MRLAINTDDRLPSLQDALRRAQSVTSALMFDVLADIRERLALPPGPAKRIRALIDAEAWTDAAFAVLELELPRWKLRHLVYEDGEWRCCLGKQHLLPDWLDDIVETSHAVLPLAVLEAITEARIADARLPAEAPSTSVPATLSVIRDAFPVSCENYS